MKALFVNGSPRKNWNTVKLLKKAMEGAQDGKRINIPHKPVKTAVIYDMNCPDFFMDQNSINSLAV